MGVGLVTITLLEWAFRGAQKRTENPSRAGHCEKGSPLFRRFFFSPTFSSPPSSSSLLPLSYPSFSPPGAVYTQFFGSSSGSSVKDHLCVFLLLLSPFKKPPPQPRL